MGVLNWIKSVVASTPPRPSMPPGLPTTVSLWQFNPASPSMVPTSPVMSILDSKRRIGSKGLDLIKSFEKFRADAYPDQGGVWTIGYGTTFIDDRPVERGMTCTHEQALEWLAADTQSACDAVVSLVTMPLTQNQLDSLISFVYNVGASAFEGSSLLRVINSDLPVTEDLFARWNKVRDPQTKRLKISNGLTRRRKAEFNLFREP